ncbi:hypothetical protein N9515_00450 [Vicingaceae bacterium]|nr:hypothetical protein [Vicingaceae bacterium]MDB4060409.1 hypothetical protein [Vicingaceae bacterium]
MRYFLLSVIFILTIKVAKSQDIEADKESEINVTKAFGPSFGVGIGTIAFYGDLNDRDYGSPFASNIGYNFYVLQPVSRSFNVKFGFFLGKVREEERSLERNLNFETDIRSASVQMEYNFDALLPENRSITPFVTAGFAAIEFNPKSDLTANGGEPYNYWTDGTIRSVSENSSSADQAKIIQRDYIYETDIREAAFNNSTTYAERSFAIPLGAGINFHLTDQVNFRFESIFHLTFTDYIDGVTRTTKPDFLGNKPANGANDHLLYNGISVNYNFDKIQPADNLNVETEEAFDFLANGNSEDYDNDGVIDLIDLCPKTPPNFEVDTNGCAIDTDGDGIADYLDEEINSEYPQFANDKGISMTDEMIYKSYMSYKDSTLEFAEIIQRDFKGDTLGGYNKTYKKYRIKIDEYNRGEEPQNLNALLSLADLKKVDQGDKSIYTVGNYKTLKEANVRLQALKNSGFEPEVVKRDPSGTISGVNEQELEILAIAASAIDKNTTALAKEEGLAFRVQLGAFKEKPTSAKYNNIPDLFIIESDGVYKYMSGSFLTFEEAAKHKIKMVVAGFQGGFVVAYKDGQRVKLRDVGVKQIKSNPLIGK